MQQEERQLIKEMLSEQGTRLVLVEKKFRCFFEYYFLESIKFPDMAPYHYERFKAAQELYNIYAEGHRESAKTTILGLALEIRKICFKKTDFICNLCYDKTKAKAFNKLLANILLTNKRIIKDFGVLYSTDKKVKKDEFVDELGMGEFVTTNGIKVKAFGMGDAIRGEIFITTDRGIVRPGHLMVDDIDNNKNTKNRRIIDEDMNFLQQEVFGGLDANAQIIWLGNVIRKDGRNPRIKNQYTGTPSRKIFSNYIFGAAGTADGTPIWSRYVHYKSEAEKINKDVENQDAHVISLEQLREDQKDGFTQNYIGKPITSGEYIVMPEWLKVIENPEYTLVTIGVDPAFSKKTSSDPLGVVIAGWKKVGDHRLRFILKSYKLVGEEKNHNNILARIKNDYMFYKAIRVRIEANNGGQIIGDLLKEEGIAVDVIHSSKDKITRMKEHEGEMQNGRVFFTPGNQECYDQLISFTGEDGKEDDLADAFVFAITEKYSSLGTAVVLDF